MTIPELINLVASLASLILSVLAISISIYFYTRSKETEKETSNLLTGISTQTEALQRLHGNMIDRLTRYATDNNPSNEILTQVFALVKEIPQTLSGHLNPPETAQKSTNSELMDHHIAEFVSSYIAIYYYSTVTNILGQFSMPQPEDYNSEDTIHQLLIRLVDMSAADVIHMENILNKVHESWIELNPLNNLYNEANQQWRHIVKKSADVMAARSKKGS